MTVDIAHLRALWEGACGLGWTQYKQDEWDREIRGAAPALFDDLEAARAKVERLGRLPGVPSHPAEWLQREPIR